MRPGDRVRPRGGCWDHRPLPLGSPKNGTIATFSTVPPDALKNLKKGLLYVNIHTLANPGSEIRGQIMPSARRGFLFPVRGLSAVFRRKF